MRPFWRYYGGKFRSAPRYPPPRYGTIVEPFAGAAGYSMRYPDRKVFLIDKYPVIVGIWQYLIAVPSREILAIPEVQHIDDLPGWVPQEARWLVGFCMNSATTSPCKKLSAGRKKLALMGRKYEGWSPAHRACVASQVEKIRHWTAVEGSYEDLPDTEATWFVDPPYQGAGKYYVHNDKGIDYTELGRWCQNRSGQTIVCENFGATWLPFQSFGIHKAGPLSKGNHEAVWLGDRPCA